MKARHVLLISDSCFSGDFFRGQRQVIPVITDASVRNAFMKRSRKAMTAGGIEPVADGGQQGHSVYTWWLLTVLREAGAPYILPEQLHDRMKVTVSSNARQKPMYGLLHGTGGEPDGTFVFFRRGTASLDAALEEKIRRINKLERLDKAAAEQLRRQQDEIRMKQKRLEELEKRLGELRIKVRTGEVKSDLDVILTMLEEKEQRAREIERLRQIAEEALQKKEQELAEYRRTQSEIERQKFEDEYAKYKKITSSEFATDDLKEEAWNILCSNWRIPSDIPIHAPLFYREGKVYSDIPVRARVRLRSAAGNLSENEVGEMLKRKNFFSKRDDWNKNYSNPRGDFANEYEVRTIRGDKAVLDHATGLMWHQSGSEKYMKYDKAKQWVDELNRRGYAGYSDWRLPTLEEGASLIERSKMNGDLYIDQKFSSKQRWIWTGDMLSDSSGRVWVVYFLIGFVERYLVDTFIFVRPVRSGKK